MKILPVAVTAVVIVSIITGFFIIGSPLTQRARRFDERRAGDLQTIQWEIVNYWQKKNRLPATLDALSDDIRGFVPPHDPETAAAYEYAVSGANSFSLCATFTMASAADTQVKTKPVPPHREIENDNWAHGTGRVCFARTIDKDLYPSVPMKLVPVIY